MWKEYSEVPSVSVMKRDFPTYKFVKAEEPYAYYVDELRAKHKRGLVTLMGIEFSERYQEGDIDAALNAISTGMVRIGTEVAVLRDENVVDTWEKDLEMWDELRKNPGLRGIPTGFPAIDKATLGLQPEQLVTLVALPKRGKAQSCSSRVLTPTGWQTIGEVRPGDYVIGSSGRPVQVVATARWKNRPLMRVATDDGGSVVVDAAHEWTVTPHNCHARTVSTAFLQRRIQENKRFAYLPVVGPVQYDVTDRLPLDPYLLGLLLGDGSLVQATPQFCKPDQFVHDEIDARLPEGDERRWSDHGQGTVSIVGGNTTRALRALGLAGCHSWEKFVPEIYLRASVEDRLLLLAGLLDTDGGVEDKCIRFSSSSQALAEAVRELVLSLGGTARIRNKPFPAYQGGTGRPAWVVTLRLPECPFRLPRKRSAYAERPSTTARPPSRRVVEVVPSGQGDTVCIQVDADDGLYLTEDFIVTHNSAIALVAANHAHADGYTPLFVTFEMSNEEQKSRRAAMIAGIDHHKLLEGALSDKEFDKLRQALQRLKNMQPYIMSADISTTTTVSGIQAKVQQYKPDVVFVDGAYLMDDESGEPKGSPQALTNITRSLKRLAQREQVPVFVTTQALPSKVSRRRGVEMDSIGYTSSFAQDSDVLLGLQDTEEEGTMELRIIAARNGPRRAVVIDMDWEAGRFEQREEIEAPPVAGTTDDYEDDDEL